MINCGSTQVRGSKGTRCNGRSCRTVQHMGPVKMAPCLSVHVSILFTLKHADEMALVINRRHSIKLEQIAR